MLPPQCVMLPQAQGNRVKQPWVETDKTVSQIGLFASSFQACRHSDSELVQTRADARSLNEYVRWRDKPSHSVYLQGVEREGRYDIMML